MRFVWPLSGFVSWNRVNYTRIVFMIPSASIETMYTFKRPPNVHTNQFK